MAIEAGKALSLQSGQSHARSIQVQTHARVEFKDITSEIQKLIAESGVRSGVCHVFTPHTSAAVLIQENDDPALQSDFDNFLAGMAPHDKNYHHNDGNCDAHLKSAVIGCSKTLLIENGRLLLGRWQGVFFCEFDGPRQRQLHVKLVAD
jgi:secondary thiamine-phosphate synthase enzyme